MPHVFKGSALSSTYYIQQAQLNHHFSAGPTGTDYSTPHILHSEGDTNPAQKQNTTLTEGNGGIRGHP